MVQPWDAAQPSETHSNCKILSHSFSEEKAKFRRGMKKGRDFARQPRAPDSPALKSQDVYNNMFPFAGSAEPSPVRDVEESQSCVATSRQRSPCDPPARGPRPRRTAMGRWAP